MVLEYIYTFIVKMSYINGLQYGIHYSKHYLHKSVLYTTAYNHGLRNGPDIIIDSSTKDLVVDITHYKNNKKHGLEYLMDDNDVDNDIGVRDFCQYKNYKLHGRFLKIYDNKIITEERNYYEGEQCGFHKKWNLLGNLIYCTYLRLYKYNIQSNIFAKQN